MSQRFVSQKYNNTEYAPGIALYGIDGKDGLSGISGTSIFVSQYSLDNPEDVRTFGDYVRQNKMMTRGADEYMSRAYMNGDAFIFTNGYIYKIKDIKGLIESVDNMTTDNYTDYLELVGQIVFSSSDDKFSSDEDRMVLDTTNYKGFVINLSELPGEQLGSIEAPMTIVSDSAGNDDLIRFIDMKSIQTGQSDVQLKIYFDTNNRCFVIDSDRPLLVNTDLEVNQSDDSGMTFDEYSKVLTVDTKSSLTNFKSVCNGITAQGPVTKVQYEYVNVEDASSEKDMTTNQIYYVDCSNGWGFDDDITSPVTKTDYQLWKYKMEAKEGNNRDYKKLRVHACYEKSLGTENSKEFKFSL